MNSVPAASGRAGWAAAQSLPAGWPVPASLPHRRTHRRHEGYRGRMKTDERAARIIQLTERRDSFIVRGWSVVIRGLGYLSWFALLRGLLPRPCVTGKLVEAWVLTWTAAAIVFYPLALGNGVRLWTLAICFRGGCPRLRTGRLPTLGAHGRSVRQGPRSPHWLSPLADPVLFKLCGGDFLVCGLLCPTLASGKTLRRLNVS
jgi:hypothetical protein